MSHDPVLILTPRPGWPEEGLACAGQVCAALGSLGLRVDHVGSTAVRGLPAKDVIDLQALVRDLDDDRVVSCLTAAGFVHRQDNTGDVPNQDARALLGRDDWRKIYFREPQGRRRVHIHVRRHGAAGARDTLLLRDFLREDEPARRDYGDFKIALAEQMRTDRSAYQAMKGPFISTLLRLAESWAARSHWAPSAPDHQWRVKE